MTSNEKLSARYQCDIKEHGGFAATCFIETCAVILADHQTDEQFTFNPPAEFPLRPSFLV